MPLVVKDRVKETTTTTGTGAVTLAGPAAGFQSFSVIGNGNTTYYAIVGGTEWEVGIGTYSTTGPTLTRDTVLESSNSGSLVNFSAGTKDVFVTYPAEKSISDGYGTLPVANGGTGVSTLSSGYLIKGNGTSAASASIVYDNGSSVSIGSTSSGSSKFYVYDANASISTNEVAAGGTGVASSRLKYSTNHYGIYVGSVNAMVFYDYGASAERMRIDSAGQVGIGSTPSAGTTLRIGKNLTGAVNSLGVYNNQAIQSDVTSGAQLFSTFPTTAAAAFTLGSLTHYSASQSTIGAGSAITNQYGFLVQPTLTGATNNYGFYGGIASGTGRWNLFMAGTAANYLAGSLSIGVASTAADLVVGGASGGDRTIQVGSAGATRGVLSTDGANGVFSIGATNDSTTGILTFKTGSGLTEKMRIDASGNVGIGTSAPAGKLDVTGSSGSVVVNAAGDQIAYTFNGFNYLTASGAAATLQIQASGASGKLHFATAGSERFRIAANGAWGLSGANYGTSGQVLTSNGSGSAPTWQAVSSKYELISTSTASAASTVDFTGLSNTYSEYIIVCRQFFTSANALVGIRTSTNNGTSYDSAANTYGWSQMNVNTGGAAGGWTGQGTEIACGYTGSGSEIDYMRIHLVNAGVATRPMFDVVVGLQQTSYGQTARTIGWRQATTAINAIRIFMSSGTITGTFYLYGVRT